MNEDENYLLSFWRTKSGWAGWRGSCIRIRFYKSHFVQVLFEWNSLESRKASAAHSTLINSDRFISGLSSHSPPLRTSLSLSSTWKFMRLFRFIKIYIDFNRCQSAVEWKSLIHCVQPKNCCWNFVAGLDDDDDDDDDGTTTKNRQPTWEETKLILFFEYIRM